MECIKTIAIFSNAEVFYNVANRAASSAISPESGGKFGNIASYTATAVQIGMMVALSSETFDFYSPAITAGAAVIGTVMGLMLTPLDKEKIAPMILVQAGLFVTKSILLNSVTNLSEWMNCALYDQCQEQPLIPRLATFLT